MAPHDVGNKVTVLAVDDKPDNLFVLEKLLAKYMPQCTVVKATSAKEGLALAVQQPPDVGLIDVQMPYVDGLEMTRRLKDDDRTAHFPIILITAHGATPTIKALGLDAGAEDFIVKPVNAEELVARMRVMLRLKRAEDDLRQSNADLEDKVAARTEALQREMELARTLLDALPCVALLIKPASREIVATNATGADSGATCGKECYAAWGQRADPCPWCLAPKLWATGKPQHLKVEAKGVMWDAHWIPVSDDLYLHYAFDITEHRRAQRQLLDDHQALEQKNIALREVLDSIQEGKAEIGRQVMANVDRIALPILDALEQTLTPRQREHATSLRSSLAELTTPFVNALDMKFRNLTPAEIRICRLIRQGQGTKEIASAERVSPATVSKHRENIRRKLEITNRSVNLTTYLGNFMSESP